MFTRIAVVAMIASISFGQPYCFPEEERVVPVYDGTEQLIELPTISFQTGGTISPYVNLK